MHRDADASGGEGSREIAPEDDQDQSVAAASTGSAKPKWKNRRKMAANKKQACIHASSNLDQQAAEYVCDDSDKPNEMMN